MNRDFVLFNLREAKLELEETINEIEGDPEYGYGAFRVAMQHLYLHINTAWNGRDVSKAEFEECSQQDFDKWKKFPEVEEFFLD